MVTRAPPDMDDKYIIGRNNWLVWIFQVTFIKRILKTANTYDIRYYVL